MAKVFKTPKHTTGRIISTKTPYGSTSDMIVTDQEILKKIRVADNCILLQDDDGFYITNRSRVDSGLSDPLRYCESFRKVMSENIAQQVSEYDQQNKDN